MFLRKSNLVLDTMDGFNKEQQLCRGDINLLGLDKAMMIEIRWSKTIQFKQKILRVPVLPVKNKAICPVFWVHYMVHSIPAAAHRPALTLNLRASSTSTICKPANIQIQEMATITGHGGIKIFITFPPKGGGRHSLINLIWKER